MQKFSLPDADLRFYESFFSGEECDYYFNTLRTSIQWEQQAIKIMGNAIPIPRLIAWYGDAGKAYRYSGVQHEPKQWTEELLAIKARIEEESGVTFNSVLLNLYRDEKDSVSWHSDDEPELGENPVIASLSFGETRQFQIKHKTQAIRQNIDLTSGSLLMMAGAMQHHYLHRIPKQKSSKEARMNLTFRQIRG